MSRHRKKQEGSGEREDKENKIEIEREMKQNISPPHGFLWHLAGPSSPWSSLWWGSLIRSSGGTTFTQSKSWVSTGHKCCSHDLRWHVHKHLLSSRFPLPAMVGFFVHMLTKPLSEIGQELAPSCCGICAYLKFHCGDLWEQCFETCNCILWIFTGYSSRTKRKLKKLPQKFIALQHSMPRTRFRPQFHPVKRIRKV